MVRKLAVLALAVLASSAALADAFPLVTNSDGSQSYVVNVLRRFDPTTGNLVATAAIGDLHNMSRVEPNTAPFDLYTSDSPSAGGVQGEWNPSSTTNTGGDPNAVADLIVDMHDTFVLNKFSAAWRAAATAMPTYYDLKGWNGAEWVDLITNASTGGAGSVTATFTPTSVSKLRLISRDIYGSATKNIRLDEMKAFVSSTSPVAMTTEMGFNAGYMSDVTASVNYPHLGNGGSDRSLFDSDMGTRVTFNGASTTQDGVVLIDYKRELTAFKAQIAFYAASMWDHGMKVEISTDNVSWVTVLNSNDPNGDGDSSDYTAQKTQWLDWVSAPKKIRYVRITGYLPTDKTANNTRFGEFELFTTGGSVSKLGTSAVDGSTLLVSTGVNPDTATTLTSAVTLSNIGDAGTTLAVSAPAVAGDDAAKFLVTPIAASIEAGASQAYDIQFLGGAPGMYSATVTFTSDATDGVKTASYTLSAKVFQPGDVNDDFKVEFSDYLVLESKYGMASGATRADADFNNDGAVDFADYLVLEANYGADASANVPEPATMSLLALGALALLRRRK